jgi:hypothetical protein
VQRKGAEGKRTSALQQLDLRPRAFVRAARFQGAACLHESAHICVNPGVAEKDLGNNFFVTLSSLGEPRAQVVTTLLLELNDEVKGTAVDEDPEELINNSPEFFSKFSCVVATDLREAALLKLASYLWTKKIPLCVGRAYGMIGLWRNVLPEVCIVESRPDYQKENYRIACPFPQLEAFAAQYDLDTCKHPHLPLTETPAGPGKYVDSQGRPTVPKAHSHTPAFVLLTKVMPFQAQPIFAPVALPLPMPHPLATRERCVTNHSNAVDVRGSCLMAEVLPGTRQVEGVAHGQHAENERGKGCAA